MTKYVALLRGINVGKHNRIPMPVLRRLLADAGCTEVLTHLQSGNALFDHPGTDPGQLADGIESAITAGTGSTIPVVIRPAAELRSVVDANPFTSPGIDPARLLVLFLSGRLDPERLTGLDPDRYAPDEFRPGEREIYLHLPGGVQNSRLSSALSADRLGLTATARNWNTVTALAALSSA